MINTGTLRCVGLVLLLFLCDSIFAQGISNKGTEFWTLYMDHICPPGESSLGSSMVIYIASDISTNGTVDIADGSFTQDFNVTANAVTIVKIPSSAFVNTQGKFLKGIHIKSSKPVAVYAHIYALSVSGATLLLPVNALGKNYMSINYKQVSNVKPGQGVAYSTLAIVATEDSTTVEITPSELLTGGQPQGVTFSVQLRKGEIYQALSLNDLTGTRVKSVSTASGSCKRIAVFSGSTKIGIGDSPPASLTSDNLFQQVYATKTWGKHYITAPLKSRPYDIYRIILSDSATQVKLNNTIIPANQFTNGVYYEFSSTATNFITADKPVQVVQYAVTQGEGLNGTHVQNDVGDPEMIYLSPIEQGLDKVTLYSSGYYNIQASYINVVLPTSAVSSFKLDGVPYSAFTPVAGKSEYSYAQIPVSSGPSVKGSGSVTSGTHNLKADQPFNAIAYGFGYADSYGYAAGTNQLDLNTHLAFTNPSDDSKPVTVACANTAYKLKLTLPYQTTRITWDIGNGDAPITQNNPNVVSTTIVDGQTLYDYEYPNIVYYPNGNHVATATVFNPFADDCGSDTDVQFFFESLATPVGTIDIPASACLNDEVEFKHSSVSANGSSAKSWLWNFGDNTTSTLQRPKHAFNIAGDHIITLTVFYNNGCSSTLTKTIHINKLPVAGFSIAPNRYAGEKVMFTDNSAANEGVIVGRKWDFGDGTPIVEQTSSAPFSHVFANAGVYNILLTISTDKGCVSTKQVTFTINGLVATAKFQAINNCSDSYITFKDLSATSSGNITKLTWYFDYDNHPELSETYNMVNMHADKMYRHNYGVFSKVTRKSYHVKLIAYSGENHTCKNVYDEVVVISTDPVITLSYNNQSVSTGINLCYDGGTVKIKEDKGIYQGEGVFSGTGINQSGRFDPVAAGIGTFTINYVFTANQTGCTYGQTFQITVNPSPIIQDDNEYIVLEGERLLLKPNVSISSGSLRYSWSPAATLEQDNIAQPYAKPTESTTYTLAAISDKGCISVKSIFVKVLKTPVIPNAFTPNSDGINDKWEIAYIDMYSQVKVDIFNRNGEKVYSSKGYSVSWDGTSRGAVLPVGTYYYIIEPGNGRKAISGHVSIIK